VGSILVFAVAGFFMIPTANEAPEPEAPPAIEAETSEPASFEVVPPNVITAEAAREMMESGEEYLLLDVRTRDEFRGGHIPGAVSQPLDGLEHWLGKIPPCGEIPILIYCQSGRRSHQAAMIFAEWGYTNVYDFGGINDWPFETVSGETQ